MRLFLILVSLVWGVSSAFANEAEIVIKSTTNRGETNIGDYWIAEDFAEGFREIGKQVDVDYRGEYHRTHTPAPQVNIFMRGYTKFVAPYPQGVNVLYVYYPMAYNRYSGQKVGKTKLNARVAQPQDANLDDDWQNYDVLAVASFSYTEELRQNGIDAIYVPQFTNPKKFYPAFQEDLKTDILFVGSNWHDRTSLRYAIESGFDVAVYGYNWRGVVPDAMYRGEYIANEDLHKYYSSAKIVLNDHRPDMKTYGFVNNRVYDASASGAMVISDYMPEIKEIYGDTIPMYRNKEELTELLTYYLQHDDERCDLAERARKITLEHFTNTAVAKRVLQTLGKD